MIESYKVCLGNILYVYIAKCIHFLYFIITMTITEEANHQESQSNKGSNTKRKTRPSLTKNKAIPASNTTIEVNIPNHANFMEQFFKDSELESVGFLFQHHGFNHIEDIMYFKEIHTEEYNQFIHQIPKIGNRMRFARLFDQYISKDNGNKLLPETSSNELTNLNHVQENTKHVDNESINKPNKRRSNQKASTSTDLFKPINPEVGSNLEDKAKSAPVKSRARRSRTVVNTNLSTTVELDSLTGIIKDSLTSELNQSVKKNQNSEYNTIAKDEVYVPLPPNLSDVPPPPPSTMDNNSAFP